MKFSEGVLQSWTVPLSQTEERRVENTVRMIREAVTSYFKLSDCSMSIFAQGSYANNTNVRQNSDVDICIMSTSTVFCNYVEGKTDKDYGYTIGTITYSDYKTYVIEALKNKFGDASITIGNKCINIKANSYHVNADVIPAFQYRDFKTINSTNPQKYIEGIKYFSSDGEQIINYPKDHVKNGKQKNIDTNYKYKKIVRIMKHVRNEMVDEGIVNGDKITSFLIECLIWNLPNDLINDGKTWITTVQNAIVYLWNKINDNQHKQWREVSERIYLFHSDRKWTDEETKKFLYNMYNFLQFE